MNTPLDASVRITDLLAEVTRLRISHQTIEVQHADMLRALEHIATDPAQVPAGRHAIDVLIRLGLWRNLKPRRR